MITITNFAKDVGKSRTTIYKIIKDLGIIPHKVQRQSLLDDTQVQQIKNAIAGKTTVIEATPDNPYLLLVEQLKIENQRLEKMLEREQGARSTERTAERERSERQDAMIAGLFAEHKRLRDENDQLKALGSPKQTEPLKNASSGFYDQGITNDINDKKEPVSAGVSDRDAQSTSTSTGQPNEHKNGHQNERHLNADEQPIVQPSPPPTSSSIFSAIGRQIRKIW